GGQFPTFVAQNPGSQLNNYYVAIHSSIQGNMGMFYIGNCSTSGSGNCTTYWPEINLDNLGTVTYDELKTVGSTAIPPNGTGAYTPYGAVYQEGDSVGNNNPAIGAIVEQGGPATGSAVSGVTGLRGFLNLGSLGQTDMYTFAYSNPFLTLATPGYRPASSATD